MIGNNSVLAIIPARGGSKGIPGKNIRPLLGKPLIAWTIEEARKSTYIDRLILSSDDPQIIDAAQACGCEVPFVRPAALARDDTPGIAPVIHAVQQLPGYDYVALLQPTSPLRRAEDIDMCIRLCVEQNANSCVTVAEAEQHPNWMYTLDAKGRMMPLLPDNDMYVRRQDLPPVYRLNGAVYVAKTDWLVAHNSFLADGVLASPMPQDRSIDIDSETDFQLAALLAAL